MKIFDKVKKGMSKAAVKVLSVATAAVSAVSMFAISAFADESGSDVIDSVTTEMTSQLTSVAAKAGIAIAGVIGVGLSIFAVKWLVGVVKGFFKRLSN